jgi:hypothetical protein
VQTQALTGTALKIANMSMDDCRDSMDRHTFRSAPPATQNRRYWNVDEIAVLAWFNSLAVAGMPRNLAGDMAEGLGAAMRAEPYAPVFWVYARERDAKIGEVIFRSSEATDLPDATLCMVAPVAQWRKRIKAELKAANRKGTPARARSE